MIKIKQIFFDLDGTLLDTAPQFHLALSNLIEIRGGEQVIFQDVRDLVSDGVNALIKFAFKISEKNKDFNLLRNELLTEYSKNYLESSLFKGTEDLLKTLNEKFEDQLKSFMEDHIYPNETNIENEINTGDIWQPSEIIEDLKQKQGDFEKSLEIFLTFGNFS